MAVASSPAGLVLASPVFIVIFNLELHMHRYIEYPALQHSHRVATVFSLCHVHTCVRNSIAFIFARVQLRQAL